MSKRRFKRKLIEISKAKPKKEEQKFSIAFSETQMTAITLIILASTFLAQGIIKYLEYVNKMYVTTLWFKLILIAIMFLIISVLTITLDMIISPIKFKRIIKFVAFSTFIIGFITFLISLIIIITKI